MTQLDLFAVAPEPEPFEVMRATDYAGQDPTGLLMSEKEDGVRAVWNGRTLRTRNGNLIYAPGWFLGLLPAGFTLDGELSAGRGRFQDTLSFVTKKAPVTSEWMEIVFLIFDAPTAGGPFANRWAVCYAALHDNAGRAARVIKQHVCRSREHFETFYQGVLDQGGEGVVLRDPGAAYTPGRSPGFLRHKPRETHEATVIGYQPGTGRNASRVGALCCSWGDVRFKVANGLQDSDRINPPTLGAVVTFSHQGVTSNGTPRFPVYVCERNYE